MRVLLRTFEQSATDTPTVRLGQFERLSLCDKASARRQIPVAFTGLSLPNRSTAGMGQSDESFNNTEHRDSYNILWLSRIGYFIDNEAQLYRPIEEPEV